MFDALCYNFHHGCVCTLTVVYCVDVECSDAMGVGSVHTGIKYSLERSSSECEYYLQYPYVSED
jgi:hypothetical protein